MSLLNKIKELNLAPDTKLLRKYGAINESDELTAEGKELLLDILFVEHKDDIVSKLKKIEAAEKAPSKK